MNILMSGSGSGGHIYPCISLYKELVKKYNVYVLIFKTALCAKNQMVVRG